MFFCLFFVHVQGGALGRYVQRKLSNLKIFAEPFVSMRENLRTGIAICEQWVVACEHLTGQVCIFSPHLIRNLTDNPS